MSHGFTKPVPSIPRIRQTYTQQSFWAEKEANIILDMTITQRDAVKSLGEIQKAKMLGKNLLSIPELVPTAAVPPEQDAGYMKVTICIIYRSEH